MSQPPRVLFSGLSGRVYVVTRYRMKPNATGTAAILVAQRKFEVTDDVMAAARDVTRHRRNAKRRLRHDPETLS